MANPSKYPTIQQELALVGGIWGSNKEAMLQAYLIGQGYPTTGELTPGLAQKMVSGLSSLLKTGPLNANSVLNSGLQPTISTITNAVSSNTASGTNVLPAQFPNPNTLSPASEPSLSSAAAGLQGQFTPSVSTIDGRPVLKAFHMVATSYGPSLADNYPYGAVDYYGQPLENGMIAVDPNVIPLGTTLYVTGYHDNYLPSGGFLGKAMDTGGAIQGDRVDIFINANPSVIGDFGVQQVTVYELGS